MGKAKTKGKQRQDKFYHLAKEQGYRSRASYKLLQLDARYDFLPSARAVLDLCAAPGGWMQVAVRRCPVGSLILGIDLDPIRPIHGAASLIADITTSKCRSLVKKTLDSNGVKAFDVVLHDGSPNVGGAWAQEATTQSALVIDSVRLCTEFLAPKGTFVTKVFRSQDYSAVLYCLKQLFEKVEATKPVASRSTSAEIYVICTKYKAPAKIDPRLLDLKHLFQAPTERPKVKDVLAPTKQKRHRDGYDEGNPTLMKVGTASDFMWSDSPLEYLGTVNLISFDNPASLLIKNHEATTEEVKSMCEDLYVLDKNSFKHLLKWRLRVRKALFSQNTPTEKESDEKTETKPKVDLDEQLLNEMEELSNIMDRKKKKLKKQLSRRRAKDKARTATGMQKDATEDSYFDNDLFSIASIKGKKDLQTYETTEINEEDGDLSENEEMLRREDEASEEEMDSDDEQRRYDEKLEEMLEEAYERFMTKKGGLKQERKRAKRSDLSLDSDLLEGDEEEETIMDLDHESDNDQEDDETNPLMVPLDSTDKPTKEQLAEKWFSQDIFTESLTATNPNSDTDDDKPKQKIKPKLKPEAKSNDISNEISTAPPKKNKKDEAHFEIVPQEPTTKDSDSDTDSSDDDVDEMDDDSKAEVLAYAKKMLRKKQREEILDDGYHKYMFDDEGLPSWFLEEERRHRVAAKPVTKEEIEAMKARFREIDARPSKKVAEAKARKKRVAAKQLDKAKKKADVIADQTDISEVSKRKMIDKLYKKAAPKRPEREYVVAKKGVRNRAGKGKVLVDRRMKKDKRGEAKASKGKGGKGKGRKGGAKGGNKGGKGKGGKGRKPMKG